MASSACNVGWDMTLGIRVAFLQGVERNLGRTLVEMRGVSATWMWGLMEDKCGGRMQHLRRSDEPLILLPCWTGMYSEYVGRLDRWSDR